MRKAIVTLTALIVLVASAWAINVTPPPGSSSGGGSGIFAAWTGPYPLIYTGHGQASGASITLNASSLVTASADLVTIASDASATGSTLSCTSSCTNTFTHQTTDYNVNTGEYYNLWTGLAGAETSYTVTATGNTVYAMTEAVWHKASGGVVTFDTTGHSLISSTGVQLSCTETTGQANAAVAVLTAGSGAGAIALAPIGIPYALTNSFLPLRTFQAPNTNAFFSMTSYGQPVAAAFPGTYFYVTGNDAGCIVYDVY